jgi:hypothetical protein
MCGLCGLASDGDHWLEELFQGEDALQRSGIRNAAIISFTDHLKIKVRPLPGGKLLVCGPTGKQQIVSNLKTLWTGIERVGVSVPDPLETSVRGNDA